MSEQQVRDALRSAVLDEPPLDFDPDALVATARRKARRRAVGSAGAGVAVIALAAAAVPIVLGTEDSEPRGSVPAAAQPTATGLSERAEELERHLTERLPRLYQDAELVSVGPFGNGPDGTVDPNGPRALTGTAVLEDDDGKLTLEFRLEDLGSGETHEVRLDVESGEGDGTLRVIRQEPGNTELSISSRRSRDGGQPAPGERERVLGELPLVQLAEDPNLSL
ncbi:hypothetical protein [Amycolatopsis cihanbeyliensis]|uniref:Uncharacterized protein n=1 Tax=Amycolatopsis cihanbeyliensis TaxID=1128664 RepID=A0A542DKF8_AMYCI|nr:hypothetical protein [Amycolatopsis cihanbeyliensis]TQJ03578.1 hypothetical protein FB471_3340 [Amycolatopsis cihanbeyliensis]